MTEFNIGSKYFHRLKQEYAIFDNQCFELQKLNPDMTSVFLNFCCAKVTLWKALQKEEIFFILPMLGCRPRRLTVSRL